MHYLVPFKGIGKIMFGMTRLESRAALNSNVHLFKRNDFAKNTTDYFPDFNLFLEYDTDDVCHGIELVSYNHLIYEGRNLFDFSFIELITYCSSFSKKNEIEENTGVTFFDLGFGASKARDNVQIETVTIFSDKYWESGSIGTKH